MNPLKQILSQIAHPGELEKLLLQKAPHPEEASIYLETKSQVFLTKKPNHLLEITSILMPGADHNETRFEHILLEISENSTKSSKSTKSPAPSNEPSNTSPNPNFQYLGTFSSLQLLKALEEVELEKGDLSMA